MRADLAKGSLSGVLQVVLTTALVLVAVPLFVRILGQEAFGLFSLVALVGNVNAFANLGLNAALVRFLAEQGKSRESDHDIVVTVLLLVGVIVPLTVAGAVFERTVMLDVLNVPPELYDDGVWLYRAMLVSNVFVLLGGTCTAVLDAQQKVHLTNLFQIVYTVVYWGLILWVILAGQPLRTIAVTTVIATVLWFAAVVAGMIATWGMPVLTGLRTDGRASMRKQLSYGVQLFSAGVIGFFYEPLTKILLAHFLGVREVGIFDIGMRARNLVSSLLLKLLYPLYPLFAKLADHAQVRFLVHDVEQKSMLVVAPVLGIVILTVTPLVDLFFGTDVDLLAPTIIWMVATYLLWGFTVTPFYTYLIAKGHAWKTVLVQILNVAANTALFLATFAWLGYFAAIAGNVASNLCTWLFLMFLQWSMLRSLIFDSWRQMVAMVLVIGISLGLSLAFPVAEWGFFTIVAAPVLVAGITLLLYRVFSVLTVDDVTRYLGRGTRAARTCAWLLCREPSPAAPVRGM
ncbi:MAG TPA: oligosaccharide flippase family protein [Bacteroidota bacterium]|nr:oligosaccharide flippase family protein [Bacteroidota bacterium]